MNIKQFLIDRFWYKIPKSVRHFATTLMLIGIFAGIQHLFFGLPLEVMQGGTYTEVIRLWALSSVLSLTVGLLKEKIVDKTPWKLIPKEMIWNVMAVALTMAYVGAVN